MYRSNYAPCLDCPAARQTERCDPPTAHSAASGYVPPVVPVARPGSRHETVGGQHDYCRADHDHVARTAPAPELATGVRWPSRPSVPRSEEHTSELQSLMRNSYDVFCLKKKNKINYIYLIIIAYTNNPN